MTPDELDELERLAKAATPGPWQVDDDTHVLGMHGESLIAPGDAGSERGECYLSADAAYIAAAHPERILRLVARVRELEHPASLDDKAALYRTIHYLHDASSIAESDAAKAEMLECAKAILRVWRELECAEHALRETEAVIREERG